MTPHREIFDRELKNLSAMVIDMMDRVHEHYTKIQNAFEEKSKKGMEKLINADQIINDLEDDINEKAFIIIMKECPVARDLRAVMTAIRIANDLERLGDYVTNIAKYILNSPHELPFRKYILKYFDPVLKMLEKAKDAYQKQSIDLAYEVVELDSSIDEIYEDHVKKFIRILKQEVDVNAEESGRILFVIKQFERAGDHLTNIAEAIIYLVRAQRVSLN